MSFGSQSFIQLSQLGFEFVLADQTVLFLFESYTNTTGICAQICHSHSICRTLNYDSQSKRCRLYEGDTDSTGVIISSQSPQSVVGSMKLNVEDISNWELPCSFCEGNQYFTCKNLTCQCQSQTFFNGSMCQSQKLLGGSCTNSIHCRIDINLTCQSNMQCGMNLTSTYTITNSLTSTSTTISTTNNLTTTTTERLCNFSCVNQTWSSPVNRLAQCLFDGNFNDQTNNYKLTPSKNITFTSNGYVKQAIFLFQMLVTSYMSLPNRGFTIDTWLYITELLLILDHFIFGLCPRPANYQCLHITIRYTSPNYYLYFGFYGGDCQGITPLKLNTWMHVAFVYDFTTSRQKIYLDEVLDNSCFATSAINVASSNITTGYISAIMTYS